MAGKRIVVFALFAVAALALALSARGSAEAQTYRPYNSYSLSNPAPGANADSAVGFGIAAPDYNYEDASMTILQPPDAWTATGLEAPIGAKVGTLNASVAVGLLGGPCNQALTPNFVLYNASVDISSPNAIPILWILQPGPIPDTDGDGLWDYLEQYPDFLNTMLDPDGSGPLLPLQPRARLAGHTSVAGFNVLVHFLIFNPGQMTQLGGIYGQMTAEKGAPALIVLNNPLGGAGATPGAISDFCTPLSTTATLLGTTLDNPSTAANEAGYTRQTNPPANTGVLASGTHMAMNYNQSERDADGDAFENDLDACRYTGDIAAWNPRVNSCIPGSNPGDQDCDMLPSSCDPNDGSEDGCGSGTCYDNIDNGPLCNGAGVDGKDAADPDCASGTASNYDQDADGYDNAQDNCPMVANGCTSAPCGPIWTPAWDNQADRDAGLTNADLGPRSDALGDACDDSDDDGNEDAAGPGTCNDGLDNGGGGGNWTDQVDIINGNVDVNESGVAGAEDDLSDAVLSLAGGGTDQVDIIDGGVDVNESSVVGAEDDRANAVLSSDGIDGADADCVPSMDSVDWPPTTADPQNGAYYHGMPWAAVCVGGVDNDGDGYCAALEETLLKPDAPNDDANGPETGAQCTNAADDDGDTFVNDGCPRVGGYSETGAECTNAVNDDAAIDLYYDNGMINDGCPTIGIPESLVIDASMTAASALPSASAPQSCSDGIDNDNDGLIDAADNGPLGCDPTAYVGDMDRDGFYDGTDNCPTVWNPTQTNTDMGFTARPPLFPAGDPLGDACDTDDDADGFTDTIEYYLPTDPLDRSVNGTGPTRSDACPLDQNLDSWISVVGDVLNYSGRIGRSISGNPPASWYYSRLDLNGDRSVTVVGDVLMYSGRIGATCT